MKNKFSMAMSLALIMAMLVNSLAFASDVDVAVVDVIVPLTGVTLAPGASGNITINMSVTGNQAGTATFEVYRNWTLSGGTFTGSNPQEFTVSPRGGGDPATTFSTNGTVTVAAGHASGGPFTLTVSVFDITNSNNSGGKLQAGDYDTYNVTVSAPADSTPPVISYVLTPSSPDGSNGWYKSNVSLVWSVTDPQSAVTKTGCVDQNITSDQAATDYSCSASSAGGSAGPVTVTIKRDATQPGVSWSGGINAADSFAYGSVPAAPTCSATDLLSGPDTCGVTGYGDSVGSHTLTATATDLAGNSKIETRSYTVSKASSTTTVSCPASVTYTGSALTPCTASATGAGGLNQSLAVSYADNTVAGTATASAFFAGDTNHDGSSDSETFQIAKASSSVTVSCPTSVVYSGSAQTPCTASATGVGGLNQSLTVSYADNTVAGTATASASFAGDTNHDGSSNSATFQIAKASSSVTVSCPASVVYNGSAQTPCTASATGVGGLNQSLTVSYADNTVAGTATASASFAGDANHDGSGDSETFEIAKAPSTTTVSCPASVVYNGSAQTPCTASATGVGGLNQSLTVSYADNTVAGTATASASFAGDTNHDGSGDSETFEIAKAPSTTTVSCPASVVYNGSAQTPCTASATGVGGLNQSLTVSYADNTVAGTATASASFAGDANHDGSGDSETFEIAKAPSTTTVSCPASVVYNGSAQTPCTASATGVGGLNQSLTVSYADNTVAGTATASASFAGDANHDGSGDSETFEIAKAPVTATAGSGSSTYDGATHAPSACAVTGDYTGDLTCANSPSSVGPDAGTTAIVPVVSGTGLSNFEIASVDGSYTINQASSTTIVTCPASVYFTGLPQTPCSAVVTGVGGLNQSLTVNYSNNTAVGTATASATYAGDLNHTGSTDSKNFQILPWTFGGFYQPVDMGGVLNTVKGGSTVPLKFEVFAGSTELTNTAIVSGFSKQVACGQLTGPEDTIEVLATGGTSLRYDAVGGQFIFNWQTPKLPGKCYAVTMTTQDGSTITALFKLK